MPKGQKQSLGIFFIAMLIYFGSNYYYGWNAKPETAGEGVCYFLVIALIVLAVLWRPVSNDVTNYNMSLLPPEPEKPDFKSKKIYETPNSIHEAYCVGIWQGDGEDVPETVREGDLYLFLRDNEQNRKLQSALLKGVPITFHNDN